MQFKKTGQVAPKVTINVPIFFIHVFLATSLNNYCFPYEESLNIIIYNICCKSVKMNISVGKCC